MEEQTDKDKLKEKKIKAIKTINDNLGLKNIQG